MDLDDTRLLHIPCGEIIGIVMLCLRLLPRDVRFDLIDRINLMHQQERTEGLGGTTGVPTERAAGSTADPSPASVRASSASGMFPPGVLNHQEASEGEILPESDTDLISELFEEEH